MGINSSLPGNATPWENIFDAVRLGLILIDEDGKVLQWNDWVAQHSGIPATFALGHTLESLLLDGLSPTFKTAIRNALAHRLPIVLSNALHRSPLPLYPLPLLQGKQDRLQQSITFTPIFDGAMHYCLIQIADASTSIKREQVLKSHSERLSKEAVTDELTGAYNRRYFNNRLNGELGRALRQHTPISLIMLDIDFFKAYNDNYGHPAGDKILISVVNELKSQMNRATDLVTRFGGEEFAIILPDCGYEGGQAIAERVRLAIADLKMPHGKSAVADRITISVGLGTYEPGSTCNATTLLEAADKALYVAKNSGRNCVRHLSA